MLSDLTESDYLRYYGGHFELRFPLWCGNVGSGAIELPEHENRVLWFEITLLAPPQAEI